MSLVCTMKAKQPVLRHNGPLFVNIKHVLVSDGTVTGIKQGYVRKGSTVADVESYFSKNNLHLFDNKIGENDKDAEITKSMQEPTSKLKSFAGVWSQIRKFCADSSLHVIKYIPDLERHVFERIFWAVMFILSLCAAVPPILQAWDRYRDDSLSIVLQQNAVPVWSIPFPEVVICNEALVRGDIMKNMKNDPKTFRNFTLLCKKYPPPEGSSFIKEYELIDFIKKYHIPIDEFVLIHTFLGQKIEMSTKNMTPRFSDFGLCFSFNALPFDDIFSEESSMSFEEREGSNRNQQWDLEKGYSLPWFEEQPIPKRALSSGYTNSYGVFLKRKSNLLFSNCAHPNAGFKVAVKNPADAYLKQENFMRVAMGRETNFLLTPKLVTTDTGTRYMDPSVRDCFQDEMSLFFYTFYTQKNCQAECLANLTLAACNCVEFFMPRANETNICLGSDDRKCAKDVAGNMEVDSVKGALSSSENRYGKWGPCNCLPPCTLLSYTFEVFNSDLLSADDNSAYLAFYFKESDFFPLVRIKQFDFLTFISTCGGLLGLFLGFSLLSFVELVFYLCFIPLLNAARKCFK